MIIFINNVNNSMLLGQCLEKSTKQHDFRQLHTYLAHVHSPSSTNMLAQVVMLLTCIQALPSSNPTWDTGYSDCDFSWSSSVLSGIDQDSTLN
jgi:hypothetical protein